MKLSIATGVANERAGARGWDLAAFRAECEAADRLGFFGAYTGERRAFGGAAGRTYAVSNPDLVCMYGLAHTENLVFGSQTTLLPLHHPLQVVQDATLVNTIYPGRYRLGLGAGYTPEDFEAFGVGLDERAARMNVGLQAVRDFLDGKREPIGPPWSGTLPVQDEATRARRTEVFVGAWSPAGVRRAATFADGWVTGPIRTIAAEARLAEIYRAACRTAGKTPRVILMRDAAIAMTDLEARERFGPYLLDYARIYFERGGTYEPTFDPWVSTVTDASEMTLDMVLPDRFLCGSAETWIETIRRWTELIEPEEIVLRLNFYVGPPVEAVLEQLEVIGREVIPSLG